MHAIPGWRERKNNIHSHMRKQYAQCTPWKWCQRNGARASERSRTSEQIRQILQLISRKKSSAQTPGNAMRMQMARLVIQTRQNRQCIRPPFVGGGRERERDRGREQTNTAQCAQKHTIYMWRTYYYAAAHARAFASHSCSNTVYMNNTRAKWDKCLA